MRIYYLNRNQQFLGPYSLDDLRSQPISKEDIIWKDGTPDWVQAAELEELACMFKPTNAYPITQTMTHPKQEPANRWFRWIR